MKIRTDFVANSSSSSFILARKGALTEQQKAAIIAYVEENLLGQRVEKGYFISGDTIDFECMFGEEYVDVLHGIWKVLEKNGDGNFVGIDVDLTY